MISSVTGRPSGEKCDGPEVRSRWRIGGTDLGHPSRPVSEGPAAPIGRGSPGRLGPSRGIGYGPVGAGFAPNEMANPLLLLADVDGQVVRPGLDRLLLRHLNRGRVRAGRLVP